MFMSQHFTMKTSVYCLVFSNRYGGTNTVVIFYLNLPMKSMRMNNCDDRESNSTRQIRILPKRIKVTVLNISKLKNNLNRTATEPQPF